jgi:hypothetical protein
MGNIPKGSQTWSFVNTGVECEISKIMIAEVEENGDPNDHESKEIEDIEENEDPNDHKSKEIEEVEKSPKIPRNVGAGATSQLQDFSATIAAQDILTCDFCNEENVVGDMYCKTCSLRLCGICVSKHIETSKVSCVHDIARFNATKDFLRPTCKSHPNYKCEMFCRQCNVPFCSQCLSQGFHKQHDITGICGRYAVLMKKILKDTHYLEENMVPEFDKNVGIMSRRIEEATERYDEIATTMCHVGNDWHKQLEVAIMQHKEEIQETKRKDIDALSKCQVSLTLPRAAIKRTIEQNKQIINSLDFNRLFEYQSSVESFRRIPPTIDIKTATFEQHTTLLHQLVGLIGKLGNSHTTDIPGYTIKTHMDSPVLLATFHSKYRKGIRRLRCHGGKLAWMCGFYDRLMKSVDLHGTMIQKFQSSSKHSPVCMTVNKHDELIFLDDHSVNIVRDGECECLFMVQDWTLRSVCSSSLSNELLVGMTNQEKTEGKVVRYSGAQILCEIQKDPDGNLLFCLPSFLTENRNFDICVTETTLQKVQVLDNTGNLRFTYSGNSLMKNTFKPMDLATDSKSQILIADISNNCIHIIEKDGKLVKIIDHFNLQEPMSISVSDNDDLWVGESNSGKVKVIKYMEP